MKDLKINIDGDIEFEDKEPKIVSSVDQVAQSLFLILRTLPNTWRDSYSACSQLQTQYGSLLSSMTDANKISSILENDISNCKMFKGSLVKVKTKSIEGNEITMIINIANMERSVNYYITMSQTGTTISKEGDITYNQAVLSKIQNPRSILNRGK